MEHVAGDVTDVGAREQIVSETRRRLGPIEVLVNNAGLGAARECEIWAEDPSKRVDECHRMDRMGPYPTVEDAENWRERVVARNKAWEDEMQKGQPVGKPVPLACRP